MKFAKFTKQEKTEKSAKFDKPLLLSILGLVLFGVLMVYDVSIVFAHDVFGGQFYFLTLQITWAVLGVICLFIGMKVDYRKLPSLSVFLFFLSLIFCVIVLLPTPFSPVIYGARRWLFFNPDPMPLIPFLGRVGFQPSELLKLSFVLFLAYFLTKRPEKNLMNFVVLLLLVVGLVMLQPDFGTALLISSIAVCMYFVSDAPVRYFVAGLPVSALVGALLILFSPYRRQRLLTYLGQSGDPEGSSYHINQVLIALGSGGLFGLGFGGSRQKYQYIPEVTTDSIFAVIGEELGFVGLVCLVAVFLFIISRGFKIVRAAPDRYSRLLSAGFVSWFAVQCVVNTAAMVHIVPLTGVPLPLVSYGGSSMIFTLTGLGILLNISSHIKEKV